MTKHPNNDGKSKASLLISIISLFMSATALWYSSLSPSDIKAEVSSLMFIWRSNSETSLSRVEPPKASLVISATCAFSNNGARTGEVSVVALRFESDDGTKWLFSPYWIADSAKLYADGFGKLTWLKGHFNSVLVPGKQTVGDSYMFYSESGLEHFQEATLTPHKFHVTLLTWSLGEAKPRQQQTATIDFDQHLVDNLRKGGMFGMPFVEEQKLVQALQ